MPAALTSWDGTYFLAIAQHGYPPTDLSAVTPDMSMAFFPGYPLAIRAVASLPAVGYIAAGFIVTAVAGAAVAVGLVTLAREIGLDRRTGLLWVALAGASPLSVVFVMTYTEPLFCALAIWTLVAVLRWQWPVAALLAVAAGLVRPTAAAIVLVVTVGALLEGWRAGGRRRVVCWLSAAAAPLGIAGYLALVAYRTGRLTGWFQIQQRGWRTRVDGGRDLVEYLWAQVIAPRSPMDAITVIVVLAIPILVWAAARIRLPWPLMLYSLTVAAMTLTSAGVMNSKIRMLLPALPLLLPLATALNRLRASTQVVTLLTVTLLSSWFGAYCLLIYPHAI